MRKSGSKKKRVWDGYNKTESNNSRFYAGCSIFFFFLSLGVFVFFHFPFSLCSKMQYGIQSVHLSLHREVREKKNLDRNMFYKAIEQFVIKLMVKTFQSVIYQLSKCVRHLIIIHCRGSIRTEKFQYQCQINFDALEQNFLKSLNRLQKKKEPTKDREKK